VKGAIAEKNAGGSDKSEICKDREEDDSAHVHGGGYGTNAGRVPAVGFSQTKIPTLVFPKGGKT